MRIVTVGALEGLTAWCPAGGARKPVRCADELDGIGWHTAIERQNEIAERLSGAVRKNAASRAEQGKPGSLLRWWFRDGIGGQTSFSPLREPSFAGLTIAARIAVNDFPEDAAST